MNDYQLLRYSRHILLPQIDIAGQEKLNHSRALIVGAGGLGSPIALYLAASGVGNLIICDGDQVDLTNLQRQIMHDSQSIGLAKVLSAKQSLIRINPEINVTPIHEQVGAEKLLQLAAEVDVVIDASDNFDTRYHINQACISNKKPLVSGAAVRFNGQISVFDLRHDDSPCYHCLYPNIGNQEDMPCAIMGVFSPIVGIIGSMQAAEALKILLNIGASLNGRLLLLDGLTMNWHSTNLPKDPACPICRTSVPTKTSTR
ncbi:HesA/MoeB/ThiF family protein [Nitrosomonas supralitoralis]|uniref:Molybdopterin-synthase adenylyltransferase n=1 Tax=Nitrosomonas supralitoralis TaxID=2116706 RepID=A0A2P7NZ80_9PROT|nr:molybdopterin-synthase adenylyltransferase MoeB [Nitrosomonas supralitoralis]PSJ18765.1 molybdopterin biosynthesis protein MoeB [Nitrosomonas supralitoralis]